MNLQALISNPGYQLNLLLWMAKEQPTIPEMGLVSPFFHELGFEYHWIENPFPLPDAIRLKVNSLPTDMAKLISLSPEPDLLLKRSRDGKAIYLEAKASMAAVVNKDKQTRGHLLANGPAFAETLMPLKESLLCYALPEAERAAMRQRLEALSQELVSMGFQPGKSSVHGFAVKGRKIVYHWDESFAKHVDCRSNQCRKTIFSVVDDGNEPVHLLLVYSAEDYPSKDYGDYYREAFLRRIQQALVCKMRHDDLSPTSQDCLLTDALLNAATEGVFKYLGKQRQRELRQLVRENFYCRIEAHVKDKSSTMTNREPGQLLLSFGNVEERENFLSWLERLDFKTIEAPTAESLPLFDHAGIEVAE